LIYITSKKLENNNYKNELSKNSSGAILIFEGITREYTENQKVIKLEYECYEPMAKLMLEKIEKEIHEKWEINDIIIAHRIGIVSVNETSLIVAVSSPHRKASFESTQYVIDRLKRDVPIWKKEFFENSASWITS
jgi:molybdopterin synthase catalytic subunit